MILLALDLELDQPKTNPDTPDSHFDEAKIIQIGWVVFDCHTEQVMSSRCIHINVGAPISAYIKKLTGIKDEDIASGVSLLEAYKMLKEDREIYGASRTILQWGASDVSHLLKELLEAGLDREKEWDFGQFSDSGLNVKHLYKTYAIANNLNSSGGLKKSMNKMKLGWQNITTERGISQHNAMNDAYNTARIYSALMKKMREKA